MEGSDLLPERFTPEEIADMGPLTDLSDGWSHMCGVSGGQARCIYSNGFGQIGDGMTMTVRTPFTVPTPGSVGGEQVVDVEVGAMGSYTCALLDSAEIWCWGIDDNFQLGAGDAARDTCTSRGFDRRCSLAPVQMMVPAGVTPVQMSLGNRHGCFVDDTGQLYCWGQNSGGQLGLGNTDIQNVPVAVPAMDDVTLVRAGLRATCALDGTGQLWCWGAGGTEGTIGDGLMDHGATCDVGSGVFDCVSTPQMVETLSDVTTFDMSWAFGCAIRASGEIWCWGDNDRRQLANGADREPQFSPVLAQGTD
jgi:alpha-tubulin suppressor-like RCC1 family protein